MREFNFSLFLSNDYENAELKRFNLINSLKFVRMVVLFDRIELKIYRLTINYSCLLLTDFNSFLSVSLRILCLAYQV